MAIEGHKVNTVIPDPDRRHYIPMAFELWATGQYPNAVSVPEACALLRVSRWSLYQLIRAGRLETVKIGSRRVVPVTALYDLLAKLGSEGGQ